MATLHVEDSLGHLIATTSLEGPPTSLNWTVPVTSGQNYRMVVDYYYDGDADEGGGYGIWTGLLSPGQNYIWWY
jgi:hypothetical protein